MVRNPVGLLRWPWSKCLQRIKATKPLTERKGKVPASALSFAKGLGRIAQGGEAWVRVEVWAESG